jgi:hypothetical protein
MSNFNHTTVIICKVTSSDGEVQTTKQLYLFGCLSDAYEFIKDEKRDCFLLRPSTKEEIIGFEEDEEDAKRCLAAMSK